MDSSQTLPQKEMCAEHNLSMKFQQLNADQNAGAQCMGCLQKYHGVILKEIYEKAQELRNQAQSLNNFEKQQLENTLISISEYKKNINTSLDKIINTISNQIEVINSNIKKMDNLFKNNENFSFEQIQKESESQKQSYFHTKQKVYQELQKYKINFSKVDHIFTRTLEHELLQQSINLGDFQGITDLTLNKDCNTLIIAQQGRILVCNFQNGIISDQPQQLNQQKHVAQCLYFMKNSNSFVSGGEHSIIIWEYEENKKWFSKHQFNHFNKFESPFCSIIMNKKEDLLITADCYLNFLSKNKSWFSVWIRSQQLELAHKKLCINEQENKIIGEQVTFGLHILELKQNKKWKIMQTILGSFSDPCFTIGDQFVVKNNESQVLEVFDYNKDLKQYAKFKEIKIDSLTDYNQLYFVKSKSILVTASDKELNIFKVDKARNYQLMEQFKVNDQIEKYTLSDSGEYLITCHSKQGKIQVRRLKYFE